MSIFGVLSQGAVGTPRGKVTARLSRGVVGPRGGVRPRSERQHIPARVEMFESRIVPSSSGCKVDCNPSGRSDQGLGEVTFDHFVRNGDEVTVNVHLNKGVTDTVVVGAASYQMQVNFDPNNPKESLNSQVYFDSESAKLDPGHPDATLHVKLGRKLPGSLANECDQVDFFTGCVIKNFNGSDYYDKRLTSNGPGFLCPTDCQNSCHTSCDNNDDGGDQQDHGDDGGDHQDHGDWGDSHKHDDGEARHKHDDGSDRHDKADGGDHHDKSSWGDRRDD